MSTLSTADVWVLLAVAWTVMAVFTVLACMPAASRPRPQMPEEES